MSWGERFREKKKKEQGATGLSVPIKHGANLDRSILMVQRPGSFGSDPLGLLLVDVLQFPSGGLVIKYNNILGFYDFYTPDTSHKFSIYLSIAYLYNFPIVHSNTRVYI
jgi:hypothetical protein